jgi:hypothetical protein
MRLISTIAVSLSLSACGVGALTPVKSYSTSESLTLGRPAVNFFDAAQEVGRSLGYRVAGIDRARNTVTLSTGAIGGIQSMTIGKMTTTSITLTLSAGGREITMDFMGTGNMGTVGQKRANERLAQLKTALLSRFQ